MQLIVAKWSCISDWFKNCWISWQVSTKPGWKRYQPLLSYSQSPLQVWSGPWHSAPCFLSSLCHWFERHTFQLFTGISEFYVTRWVDKTRQEAGSWGLSPTLLVSYNSWWRYFFNLSNLIADRGPWYFQVCQSHSTFWMPQKPFQLRVLSVTSEKWQGLVHKDLNSKYTRTCTF